MTDTVVCDCEGWDIDALPAWPDGADADRDRNQRPIRITLDNQPLDDVIAASRPGGWVAVARRDQSGKPVFHRDHFATRILHGRVEFTSL